MRYHIEVIGRFPLRFDQTSINDGTRRRIQILILFFLCKPRVYFLVDKSVKDFRLVIWSEIIDRFGDLINFIVQHLFLHSWASDTIAIDSDVAWSKFIPACEILKGS